VLLVHETALLVGETVLLVHETALLVGETVLLVPAFPTDQLQAPMLALATMDRQHQDLSADRPTLLMKASCLIHLLHSRTPAPVNDLLSLETSKYHISLYQFHTKLIKNQYNTD